ncbi:MAG: PIN domain-containing protein [Betaproteobacteria bacterium]
MFLLDTNVVSELRLGKANPSPAVRAWAAGQPIGTLYLSAITILELEQGVLARSISGSNACFRCGWRRRQPISVAGRSVFADGQGHRSDHRASCCLDG